MCKVQGPIIIVYDNVTYHYYLKKKQYEKFQKFDSRIR